MSDCKANCLLHVHSKVCLTMFVLFSNSITVSDYSLTHAIQNLSSTFMIML